MSVLMLDSRSGKKWQWIASSISWLRMLKPAKRSIVSFYAQNDPYGLKDLTIQTLDYRKEKFYIMGKYIHLWIPNSVPLDKTEEYIFKQILNRNFLKAIQ